MRLLISLTIILMAFNTYAQHSNTSRYLRHIRYNPQAVQFFVDAMPKGADLHNHLAGAVYAENLMAMAQDKFCIKANTQVYTGKCNAAHRVNQIGKTNPGLYRKAIALWSLNHLVETPTDSASSHFFDSFNYFFPIVSANRGNILARMANRAAREHLEYIELMVTPDDLASAALAKNLTWHNNPAQLEKQLDAKGMATVVKNTIAKTRAFTAEKNKILGCGTSHDQPGCAVKVRYLYQILRDQRPARVFAQMLLGYRLAKQDKQYVGVNIVQPEHGYYAIKDYTTHMKMFAFLSKQYPGVRKSLHAGELTMGIVTPENLTFHINQAVHIAHADRIGHGVDISYEHNAKQLLQYMAQHHILVEINLTSNADILGVKGKVHPLHLYLENHVPVALSTDDEGILCTDLNQQYKIAIMQQHVSYHTLKQMDRNSLTYSFLPGKSLWANAEDALPVKACSAVVPGSQPDASCQSFLATSLKARLQWRLEKKLRAFEARI
jgi:adenosine deaminase